MFSNGKIRLLLARLNSNISHSFVVIVSIVIFASGLIVSLKQDITNAPNALAAISCPVDYSWNGSTCAQVVPKTVDCPSGGIVKGQNCVPDDIAGKGIKMNNCRIGVAVGQSACYLAKSDSVANDRAIFGYNTACGNYTITQSDITGLFGSPAVVDFITNKFNDSQITYYLTDYADNRYCMNPLTWNLPFLQTESFVGCILSRVVSQTQVLNPSQVSCDSNRLIFSAATGVAGTGNIATTIYSTKISDSRPTASTAEKKLECSNPPEYQYNPQLPNQNLSVNVNCNLLEKTLTSATGAPTGTSFRELGTKKTMWIDKTGFSESLSYPYTGSCPSGFTVAGNNCQKTIAPIGQSFDSTDLDPDTAYCSPRIVKVLSLSYCSIKLKPALAGVSRILPENGIYAGIMKPTSGTNVFDLNTTSANLEPFYSGNSDKCTINQNDYLYCPVYVPAGSTFADHPIIVNFPTLATQYLITAGRVTVTDSIAINSVNTIPVFSQQNVTNCSERRSIPVGQSFDCFFDLPLKPDGSIQLYNDSASSIKAFVPYTSGNQAYSNDCTVYNNFQGNAYWGIKKTTSIGNQLDYGGYFDLAPSDYSGSIPSIISSVSLSGGDPVYLGWAIDTAGDFDGDGFVDLIWRNYDTGEITFWLGSKNEGQLKASGSLGRISNTNLKIVGMGDWDKDGDLDLYFANYVDNILGVIEIERGVIKKTINAKFNGTEVGSNSTIKLESATNKLRVQVVKDLNKDGNPDMVFRNRLGDGTISVWYMDANLNAPASTNFVTKEPDLTKDIAAIEDFNNDGKFDILWKKYGFTADKDITYWYMDGLTKVSGSENDYSVEGNPNWRLIGAGDLNGDGIKDLIWKNYGANSSVLYCKNIPTQSSSVGINDIKLISGAQISTNVVGKIRLSSPFNDSIDFDFDGLTNVFECGGNIVDNCLDSDSDGTPNWQDKDSDNDEIPDRIEVKRNTDGFYIAPPVDTDNDTIADYLDLDSDDDLIFDLFEKGTSCPDIDNCTPRDSSTPADGIPDYRQSPIVNNPSSSSSSSSSISSSLSSISSISSNSVSSQSQSITSSNSVSSSISSVSVLQSSSSISSIQSSSLQSQSQSIRILAASTSTQSQPITTNPFSSSSNSNLNQTTVRTGSAVIMGISTITGSFSSLVIIFRQSRKKEINEG
jgi:hypothetical protein